VAASHFLVIAGRGIVIVDVSLATVFLLEVFVRRVLVSDRSVIVLVIVAGAQVLEVRPFRVVVCHVKVLVAVDQTLMGVHPIAVHGRPAQSDLLPLKQRLV
jgi:hypothetical protein